MSEVIGIIIVIVLGSILCVAVLEWFSDYCELKRRVEESDDFEKLMRKQLELDTARLKAQEDLLREACRSWAEDDNGEEYEEE
jgi:hypothetical protein